LAVAGAFSKRRERPRFKGVLYIFSFRQFSNVVNKITMRCVIEYRASKAERVFAFWPALGYLKAMLLPLV